jgi:hypothetical protein
VPGGHVACSLFSHFSCLLAVIRGKLVQSEIFSRQLATFSVKGMFSQDLEECSAVNFRSFFVVFSRFLGMLSLLLPVQLEMCVPMSLNLPNNAQWEVFSRPL